MKLQKPFAVLTKEIKESSKAVQYSVKAVVRRKIIFKSRPNLIICDQASKSSS